MDVRVRKIAQTTVLEMNGRLNGNGMELLEEEILPSIQSAKRVLVDLGRVSFLSSSGLRMLLLLQRQVNDNGGRLVIVGLSEELRDTMAITGFLDFFSTYDTLASALKALETP